MVANPFELARLELDSPQPAGLALASLDRLLRDGFEAGGRRYRVFGSRHGGAVRMSLGLPFVGGAAPILAARLRSAGTVARFDVRVHARAELVVLAVAWASLVLLGGGLQLGLRVREVLERRATLASVGEVLPGILVMAACAAAAFAYFRHRATRDAGLLVGAFRDAIGAGPPARAIPIA